MVVNDCSRIGIDWLEEVNVSWCGFGRLHVAVTVAHLPETVTQLNVSGHRGSLTDTDVQVLCQRCPRITNLDMSDSSMLTSACLPFLQKLPHLQHLGLSRCHHIPAARLGELAHISSLKTLSIFGLVPDSTLDVKDLIPHIQVNAFPLTSIARPTPAQGKARTVWGISCRLALRTL
ncbi:S-phase kinase-associated protein 2 [Rhinoraja longicauda]